VGVTVIDYGVYFLPLLVGGAVAGEPYKTPAGTEYAGGDRGFLRSRPTWQWVASGAGVAAIALLVVITFFNGAASDEGEKAPGGGEVTPAVTGDKSPRVPDNQGPTMDPGNQGPAGGSVGDPGSAPNEDPIEKPAEKPVDEPKEQPADKPSEQPFEKPAEEPEKPVDEGKP